MLNKLVEFIQKFISFEILNKESPKVVTRKCHVFLHKPVEDLKILRDSTAEEFEQYLKDNNLLEEQRFVPNDVVDGGEIWLAELLANQFTDDTPLFTEITSGIDGITTQGSTTFTRGGGSFSGEGVVPGNILHLHGANSSDGFYTIKTVGTTTLVVDDNIAGTLITNNDTAIGWAIYESLAGGLKSVSIGTGTTEGTPQQIGNFYDLETPVAADDGSQPCVNSFSEVSGNNKFTITATWAQSVPASQPYDISEAGIFSTNRDRITPVSETEKTQRMLNRTVFASINKSSAFALTLKWTVEIGSLA